MQAKKIDHGAFVKQLRALKQDICPERYRYTLEFIDLAVSAAHCEGSAERDESVRDTLTGMAFLH